MRHLARALMDELDGFDFACGVDGLAEVVGLLGEEGVEVDEVEWERRFDDKGYVLRKEKWKLPGCGKRSDEECAPTEIVAAYSLKDGGYIGNAKMANFLAKRGILPEKGYEDSEVCCIGFCEKEKKWYGWSHRAICGFGIGDRIFDERYGTDSTPFVKHGKKKVKTLDDAKKAAKAFAGYVA